MKRFLVRIFTGGGLGGYFIGTVLRGEPLWAVFVLTCAWGIGVNVVTSE